MGWGTKSGGALRVNMQGGKGKVRLNEGCMRKERQIDRMRGDGGRKQRRVGNPEQCILQWG